MVKTTIKVCKKFLFQKNKNMQRKLGMKYFVCICGYGITQGWPKLKLRNFEFYII